ncbi:unnamed protein product, partial [Symbiodinium sp. KB8]
MFSPNLQLFAAVRLHTTFTTTGGAFSVAHVRTFTKSNDRFPPSRLFQLILAAHICIEIFMLSKETVRRGWAVFRNGWFLFELFSFAEFVILLCFDIYAYSFMQDVFIDIDDPTTVVNMWELAQLLQIEFDLIALVVLGVVIRFIKYFR